VAQLREDPRTAQLAANLAEVRDRIARSAREVGRDPGEVALIAVTKTFDADDVRRLAGLGIAEFGENRDQEAAPKAAAVPEVRWHFLGRIQRNKIRSIASYADSVDSVDRAVLIDPLDRAVAERAGPLDVLVQVSLDGDPARGGVRAADLPDLADRVEAAEHLRLAGLMAVAPLGGDVERSYADLADLAARIRAAHPQAKALSAGMSGDLEAAVRHGSTQVRVGTALLGGRPPVVR
jgi:PLP dependent protein